MKKILIYANIVWQELRPEAYVLLVLHVCIGFAATWLLNSEEGLFTQIQLLQDGWVLLVALLGVASWYVFAVGLNDIADYDIDRVNLSQTPGRPLHNGSATKQQLKRATFVAMVVALGVGLLLGPLVTLLILTAVFLVWGYSVPPLQFSHRGFLAPFVLPICYVIFPMLIAPLYLEVAIGTNYALLTLGMYLVFVGRVMLKDYRDIEGDRQFNKRTFLLSAGHAKTTIYSMVSGLMGTALVALSVFLLTGRPEATLLVALLGTGVVSQYKAIYNIRAWGQIKPRVIRISGLFNLQFIVVFSSILYTSDSVSVSVYIALCGLTLVGLWRLLVVSCE